jgi:hypothetical protein
LSIDGDFLLARIINGKARCAFLPKLEAKLLGIVKRALGDPDQKALAHAGRAICHNDQGFFVLENCEMPAPQFLVSGQYLSLLPISEQLNAPRCPVGGKNRFVKRSGAGADEPSQCGARNIVWQGNAGPST